MTLDLNFKTIQMNLYNKKFNITKKSKKNNKYNQSKYKKKNIKKLFF